MLENPTNQLPVEYRRQDLEKLFGAVKRGESCFLTGVGSGGKSVLLRHTMREDVQRFHLGTEEALKTMMILIDPHMLSHLEGRMREEYGTSWMGWELMTHRLRLAISDRRYEELGTSDEELKVIEKTYDAIRRHYERFVSPQTMLDGQLGLRCFEESLHSLLLDMRVNNQPLVYRLVFMFDELEEFFRILPSHFFQALRGLRDEYKGQVVFVTSSRTTPKELLLSQARWDEQDRLVVESFTELLHGNGFYIGLLDEISFRYNWLRYCELSHVFLGEHWFKLFYEVTAGHTGLMRRSFEPLIQYADTTATKFESAPLIEYLMGRSSILEECQILFDSLSADERQLLTNWVQHEIETNGKDKVSLALKGLVEKSIIYRHPETMEYQPLPLLYHFLLKYPQGLGSLRVSTPDR